jgi:rare lipoprotein A
MGKKAFLIIVLLFFGSCCVTKPKKETVSYVFYDTGMASWYGKGFDGKKTSSGEIFHKEFLSAAHRTLAFGTFVRVTNLNNKKSVIVKINDRGPVNKSRVIDLSEGAAKEIDMINEGVVPVRLELVKTAYE